MDKEKEKRLKKLETFVKKYTVWYTKNNLKISALTEEERPPIPPTNG